MDITTTFRQTAIRQAKLRPESADLYPTLPACMWTSATCVAELVVSYRGARGNGSEKLDKERILSDADFEFRGGFSRWSGGALARTRINELPF